MGHMTIYVLVCHVIAHHPHSIPRPVLVPCQSSAPRWLQAFTATAKRSRRKDQSPVKTGTGLLLRSLTSRKHDYLVKWDGINPETGRAWTPSWTSKKTEVTEDLIEVWETKKAAKKKKINVEVCLVPLGARMNTDYGISSQ
jgi:hypothetical protein